jgi:hypothetical protein
MPAFRELAFNIVAIIGPIFRRTRYRPFELRLLLKGTPTLLEIVRHLI